MRSSPPHSFRTSLAWSHSAGWPPGWRFERWEWRPLGATLAPTYGGGEGEERVYTAVFVPGVVAAR